MLGTLFTLPSDFVPQTLEVSKSVFKMFSPILVPIVAVGIFTTTLSIIINRIRQLPLEPGVGFFSRIIKQKKLIVLLLATVSAFSTWLALQPPEFQQAFMFPIQLLTGLVVSDKALYTLAMTLFGIAVVALFL